MNEGAESKKKPFQVKDQNAAVKISIGIDCIIAAAPKTLPSTIEEAYPREGESTNYSSAAAEGEQSIEY